MRAVRMAGQQFASAKRHGRGRSPRRACRNAKQCKVCRHCCRAFLRRTVGLNAMDQFACAVASIATGSLAGADVSRCRVLSDQSTSQSSGLRRDPLPARAVWRRRVGHPHSNVLSTRNHCFPT
ncbi:hypothetical protein XdyCFBP7245_06980 [Xanthomonas dyei]|uniref:Uncharacterized protein n=1 Tax=Xanthomonas dyei TaxID=743699 RepID=A0A2S7C6E9_9XANT|nr:hypothetical protein XdyCFBP7245_06980 [Xanthomonas dyei]